MSGPLGLPRLEPGPVGVGQAHLQMIFHALVVAGSAPRHWRGARRSPRRPPRRARSRAGAAPLRRYWAAQSSRSPTPSPLSAERTTTSSRRAASARTRRCRFAVEQVDLVPGLDHRDSFGSIRPDSAAPISSSTRSTSSRWASLSGCEMSRTWTMRSADDHLLQRRPEGGDELGRQVGDEADRVRQDRLVDARQAISRIVGSSVANSRSSAMHVGAGQPVEQGRFAGIGVADQRDHRPRRALAPGAVQRAGARTWSSSRLQLAPCGRGSAGGRPRSGSRPGRRGSRSRRAGARGGSS